MPALKNLFLLRSIGAKLALMTLVGAICMALVASTVLWIARGQLVTERIEKAHAAVDIVWNLADGYYKAFKAGQMTEEEARKRFLEANNFVWYEDHSNYAYIYDYETGLCVSNPGIPQFVGKDMRPNKDANGMLFAVALMDIAKKGQGTLRYSFRRSGADATPLDKVAFTRGFAPWNLMIGSAEYMSEVDNSFWSMVQTASVVIAVLMLISIMIAWAVGRSVVKPLTGLRERMASLSEGQLDAPVAHADRRDEIGEMARTVQVFRDAMLETNRMREAQAVTEQRQGEARKVDMNRLADQFEREVGEIIELVSVAASQLETSSTTLSKTADTVAQVSGRASTASGEASANVHSVAAASEELASSIGEISRQVESSARIAGEAVNQAQKTDARMSELSQAASRIGDVVDLIQTIAGQTNLLALNATIEAARAGEAGRGFAVVASEVKSLAEQTAKATDEISQQINDIQSATRDSVAAIKEIGTTIGRISEISAAITTSVEQQGSATQEISRNVQRAAAGTSQVEASIADVQRGASETGGASAQVQSAAQSLATESTRLKRGVAGFMNSIRAA
ncbi:methyl-accepting chemotaxis protein [Bradyrhizobium sp. 930_D9_N1_4]|uniref:methyl-accepting chemotaxis protein n=1 Tax=Bradyrhizobium sp. 930_D9_N1_4 TaxID=3240374 RepID=UPI003F8B9EB6